MGLDGVQRRLDVAERDRVHANTALGVLDGERLGRRVEAALRQRREDGGNARHRVVDETRGDLDDMAAALLFHLGDGELRDVEESGEVDAQDGGVVGLGVLGEGLGDEDAGVVDECVDAPESLYGFEIVRSAVFRSAMSPGTTRMSASLDGLTDRAVATTR